MHYLVYKITHIDSGKYYIGAHATENIYDNYMGSGRYIKNAVAKHGIEKFTKEILVECFTSTDMYFTEAELVIVSDDTYNTMPGGKGGWEYVNKDGKNGSAMGVNTRLELLANQEWYATWKKAQAAGAKKYSESVSTEEYSKRGAKANATCFEKTGKYSFSGKQHTEETKRAIAAKSSNRNAGINNPMSSRMWITDGIVCKVILKESMIPDGWRRGKK